MMLKAVVLVNMLGALMHPQQPAVPAHVYGLADWRLTVAKDRFTSETRCRLEDRDGFRPDMALVASGLAVSFGRRTDVSEAWYKLDDRPARPWRDLRAKLLAAGSLAELERLDNPSGGWIVLPPDVLGGAQSVTIRVRPGARPRIFALGQEPRLAAAAQRLGCRFADDPGR